MTPDKDEELARLRAENARFAGLLDCGPQLFGCGAQLFNRAR